MLRYLFRFDYRDWCIVMICLLDGSVTVNYNWGGGIGSDILVCSSVMTNARGTLKVMLPGEGLSLEVVEFAENIAFKIIWINASFAGLY